MSLLFSTFIHYRSPSWWRDLNLSHQNWTEETKNILLKAKRNIPESATASADIYGQIFSRSLSWQDAKPRPMGRQTRHHNILDHRRSMNWTWNCFYIKITNKLIDERIFPIGVKFLKFASLEDSFVINVKLLVSVLGYSRLTKSSQFWIRNK